MKRVFLALVAVIAFASPAFSLPPEIPDGRYVTTKEECEDLANFDVTDHPSLMVIEGDTIYFYEVRCRVTGRKLLDNNHRLWLVRCQMIGQEEDKEDTEIEFWRDRDGLFFRYGRDEPELMRPASECKPPRERG